MASRPKTTGTTGTNQWAVRGVAKRFTADPANLQSASDAAQGLQALVPEKQKEASLKKFSSRWRINKKALAATGAEPYSEQVEYLRAWSERGRNEKAKDKRRQRSARILTESFPSATQLDAYVAIKLPPEQLQQEFTSDGKLKNHMLSSGMREGREKRIEQLNEEISAAKEKQRSFDEKINKINEKKMFTALLGSTGAIAASGAAMIAGVGAAAVVAPAVAIAAALWGTRFAYRVGSSQYYYEKARRIQRQLY